MKHLDDGQIRAAVDGELAQEDLRHLEECPRCQARLAEARAALQPVARRLSFLASRSPTPDPRAALARFHNRQIEKKEHSMLRKIFTARAVQAALAVIVLLALVLSIPTTRAWAGQFLGLFRVQRVTVLPVDTGGFEQLVGNDALGQQISQVISSSVRVTKQPDDPVKAASAAEASQKAGFTVRLPAGAPSEPRLTVTGSGAFEMKVDRAKVQALLDETGRSDLVLPESLDGANIQVGIPAGVRAAYGTCPEEKEGPVEGNGSLARKYGDCLLLVEMPSPTVNTPPDVDFRQLAVIGLQFTGMTREEAEQYSQTVDWTTSLVIPIPRNAATYQTVTVDGVEGQLIQRPADDAPQFALVWVKDGIIHAISGWGDRSEAVLKMANSLQ